MTALEKAKQFVSKLWQDCRGPVVYWDLVCICIVFPAIFILFTVTGFGHGTVFQNLYYAYYAAGIVACGGLTLCVLIPCAFLWAFGILRPVIAILVGPIGAIFHMIIVHWVLWYISARAPARPLRKRKPRKK